MHTVQLKISEKVYDRIIWLLSKFNSDEVEVILEDTDFKAAKSYLQNELEEMNSNKAEFISQSEFENRLNNII